MAKMKINEKNLCNFAVSTSSPIDREGYLYKRGEVNKSFQRRYFVLKGNLLFYFDRKGDKEPVGVIILEGSTIELHEDESMFCFKIVFHGVNNRSYILGAESQESMELWMKALACAPFDYIKLMVAELRAQLEEIDETPMPTTPPVACPVPPPRVRHNPFNKPESPHQRSHSLRSIRFDERSSDQPMSKSSISFRELHNAYGRPILRDYNLWKNELKQLNKVAENNLITF